MSCARARRAAPLAAGVALLAGANATGANATGAAAAEAGVWRDLESRIQYDYYSEDLRALNALEETVAGGGEAGDVLRDYYVAFLAWREALLAARGARVPGGFTSGQLADRCVARLDSALATRDDYAEGLALKAACLLAPLGAGGHATFAVHRAHQAIAHALLLASANPRVLLIDALGDYELPLSSGGNKERALGKLRRAVAAFEAERRDTQQLPGWGAAEAYLVLARSLLEHGDAVAARDALERALVIAPELSEAHQLLQKITSG